MVGGELGTVNPADYAVLFFADIMHDGQNAAMTHLPSQPLTDEFKSDCLIWTLFAGKNLSAGADSLQWNAREWSLVNHFIPFTEAEVGAKGRFESDFMVRYMAGMVFSPEARTVLDEGRKLWRRYHGIAFPRKIRDELKLNRPDVGGIKSARPLKLMATAN